MPAPSAPASVSRDGRTAALRGVYEVSLAADAPPDDPWLGAGAEVVFRTPAGTETRVDAFYDGSGTYRARAYCGEPGVWRWRAESDLPGIAGRTGAFDVVPSPLKGKLRVHPADPYQLAYDDGGWFLHLGDTGYRYLVDAEPLWREYVDQAAAAGFTKIRAWTCRGRGDVQAYYDKARRGLDLAYWQEMDRRLLYALEQHDGLIFQVILYGEDSDELRRYAADDPLALLVARYAQARYSALSNVTWCISNDRRLASQESDLVPAIDRIGREMAAREPWGTLLTNHQARFEGYSFVGAPWSDIITLEDLDQLQGSRVLEHRRLGRAPVILDEDRYEHYRPPAHPRYYFRRLMWANLLSGGAATYGGLCTYEPYDGALRGVQGYADAVRAGKLAGGADDMAHIHDFFRDSGLTLAGMEPDDGLVGANPAAAKCARIGDACIVYLPNPSGPFAEGAHAADAAPAVRVGAPAGSLPGRWFKPSTGAWCREARAGAGGIHAAPGGGDWVLLLGKEVSP